MIFELRSYQVAPGRLAELVDNAERFAVPLQQANGFDVVGCWTRDPDEDDHADFVYLLRWESQLARQEHWQRFLSDTRWTERQADTGANGPLVVSETVQILHPTRFSGLT